MILNFDTMIKQSPLYGGTISSASVLNVLGNKPKKGEIFYCEAEEQYYIFNDKWMPYEQKSEEKLELNLYNLNKQIIEQLGPINTEEQREKIYNILNSFHIEKSDNNFFLLFGKEISYFTLFQTVAKDAECANLAEGVIECLENVGELYSVETTKEEDAVEIWVKEPYIGLTVLYLFPYDQGVCTIGG